MLALTRIFRRRNSGRSSDTNAAPVQAAVTSTSGTAVANNGTTGESIALTQKSQDRNPYEGFAPGSTEVKVGKWGQPNGSVEQILVGQGYTLKEIYNKDSDGKTLADHVTDVNGLRNPNLVRENQSLVVPSKEAPQQAEGQNEGQPEIPVEPEQREPPREPEQAELPTQPEVKPELPEQTGETEKPEPAVNQVTADRWRQGDNDSLGAILKNQGFTDEEIYNQDADGDSLLKKVARANGLESPDKIQAGKTYEIPNSREALEQMDIPDMPPEPEPPKPVVENERTEPNTDPVQQEEQEPEVRDEPRPAPQSDDDNEVTANMGMLLNGVKEGKFTRSEFQYLNARSGRYAQLRSRYAKEGYDNDELRELGSFEQRYGVEFARLANGDRDLSQVMNNVTDPDLQLQVRQFNESGPLYDQYKNGTTTSEDALAKMVRQREQARQEEAN